MLRISQRPLTGSDADQALFVDRQRELDHLARSAHLNFNVLVLGDRGAGITSLLRQHQRRLDEAGRRSFYVSGTRVTDLDDLISAIRISVTGPRGPTLAASKGVEGMFAGGDEDPLHELRELAEAASADAPGHRPIVVLDDMRHPALVHELFGRYRDDVWQLPFLWVVGGLSRYRNQYLEPPADAFFDTEVTLGPLDRAAAGDLLLTRLASAAPSDSEATERIRADFDKIIKRSEGNPRHILAGARAALLRSPEEIVAADRLMAAAAQLGMSEALVLRHLLDDGPTSASDEELQDLLGITRARTTQVFRRLEDAGLVSSFVDKSGVGRPRKLYTSRLGYEEAE